ncbi:MAG: hypothetical protein F6K21_06835 [Symploca sp. SIO2D2]|nr:hypothetical protein [Symploca sp. SIO2D2]
MKLILHLESKLKVRYAALTHPTGVTQLKMCFRDKGDKGDKEDKGDGDTPDKNLYLLITHYSLLRIAPF